MSKGRFIALEGGEGVGKSTQARLLADALEARGIETVLTREPGGTTGAEAIRSLLLHPPGEGWDARTEALLFAAARADHVSKLIRPALAAGKWVICDRFIDSSRAYQGGGGGLSDGDILALHAIGSEGLLPDLTLVLTASPVAIAKRLAARDGGVSDAIGGRDADYHAKVSLAFTELAMASPERFSIVSSSAGPQQIHKWIMDEVEKRLLEFPRMSHSGHDEPWREWRAALAGPRMHHGWLLAGKRGIGKVDFALAAARELVAEDGVRQLKEHPDIIVLTHLPKDDKEEAKRAEGKPFEVKRNITVAQIREMQQRLTTRPTLGNRRAIVIHPADDLEKSAANALLKSLEEPPQGSFFLLVAHRPGRLLPTIRSRCRVLRFAELSEGEVEAFLAREAPEAKPETRAMAAAAAGGSPGVALEFVEHDLAPLHKLMARILAEGDREFALRGALADAIGQRPSRERQLAAIELARAVLAGEMRRAGRAQLPGIIEAHGELNRLSAQAPTYNFDPALLVMEIGSLLASAAMPRETA